MKTSKALRVSPISIIYFCIANIYKAFNLWPVLAGIIAIPATREWLFDLGIAGVALLILVASIINYWFFTFYIDDEKIQIHSGLIFKKKLTLYFERVQEANLEQALYFRPFGLWALKLESAGSSKEEIILPGIQHILALELKQCVLDAQKHPAQKIIPLENEQSLAKDGSNSHQIPAQFSTHVPIRYQIKLDVVDLLRYGLMHNTLIYYVAILAPVLSQNDKFWKNISSWIGDSWVVQQFMSYLDTHSFLVAVVVISILVLLFFASIYAISIILALVKFWNYHLTIEGDRFQYQAGLLNKLASGFRQHKLQTLIVKQSLIARWLKRYSIEVKQANESRSTQGEINFGFIIPVVTKEQLTEILQLLNIKTPEWKKCAPIKMFWDTVIWGGSLSLITAIMLISIDQPVWWSLGVLLLISLMNIKNWYSIGYEINQEGFAAKHGILGLKTIYVPQIKIQKIQLAQGPIQRLHNTASITLWSGATLERLNFIPLEILQSEREKIISTIARFHGRWM